jgi:hypothetical protein
MTVRLHLRPIAVAACAALCAPWAGAASLFDLDVWMRAIDQHSVTVQQNLARREAQAAQADARRIETLYALLEDYYAQGGRPADARQISREGKEQAAAIVQALEGRDFDAALTAALRITRACNECHDNHKFY